MQDRQKVFCTADHSTTVTEVGTAVLLLSNQGKSKKSKPEFISILSLYRDDDIFNSICLFIPGGN